MQRDLAAAPSPSHAPKDASADRTPDGRDDARGRWRVLLAYTLVAGVSQLLWLNFAPILTLVEARFGVREVTASALVLVFPALYVVLSIPAGSLIDRHGYRVVVRAAAVAQAAFACLRIASDSFAVLLVAQIGIAVAQPFIMNAITKLVADWFEPERGAIANGVGTIGMFLGMAVAMGATPLLTDAYGLRAAMCVFAGVAVVAALVFLRAGRERGAGAASSRITAFEGLLGRDLVLLYAVSFLGLGFFNALTTWLEAIVAPNGIGAVGAGILGAVLIVAGIAGAAVIPALSDRVGRRKPFVVACAAVALLATYPLCTAHDYRVAVACAAVLGFAFLPAYALLLEMCTELAGAEAAGRATGILLMMGNAGGVVLSLAIPAVSGEGTRLGSRGAVAVLLGAVLLAIALASRLVDTRVEARLPER